MSQVKIHSGGQVTIPPRIFSKYRLQEGDTLEVFDAGNGIIFLPKNGKTQRTKEHFFKIVEKIWARNRNIDSGALDRVINRAVRTVRAEERKRLGL